MSFLVVVNLNEMNIKKELVILGRSLYDKKELIHNARRRNNSMNRSLLYLGEGVRYCGGDGGSGLSENFDGSWQFRHLPKALEFKLLLRPYLVLLC